MAFLRFLTLGFGAGAFGGLILWLAALGLSRIGVPAMLGLAAPLPDMYAALAGAIVWGGAWGLLFAAPVMNRAAWLKGIVIGLLATAALMFYFAPGLRAGPPLGIAYVAVLNGLIWGIAGSVWWALVSGPRKNGRRFGTFMR